MEEQKTIYTFTFGRNLYTIRLKDVKKVTLLEHKFTERSNDVEEVIKTIFMFQVSGDLIQPTKEDSELTDEVLIEVKAEESDYATLYKIYVDLNEKWDAYQLSVL